MLAKGNTAIEAVVGRFCVLISPLSGEERRVRVCEEYKASESETSRAPSVRQNVSASSLSRRLHVGQRFILGSYGFRPIWPTSLA